MHAILEHVGHDLLCRTAGAAPAECRIDGEALGPALRDIAQGYDHAVRSGDDDALAALGQALFQWLDPSGWASAWAAGTGPRSLEIRVTQPADPLATALLDAPWELLAQPGQGFLADDATQLYELARRIGTPDRPAATPHGDLQLMFMAAAPAGEHELDFEAEEGAILDATQRLPLHLVVEESGSAALLAERLQLEGPFEALHLSCHGEIDAQRGPFLALEDEDGSMLPCFAGELAGHLAGADGANGMPLVFLSACRTAEQTAGPGTAARPNEPFVRNLVRAGVLNVLGWDGSVYDRDAADFARSFYSALAGYAPVAHAAAQARRQLRQHNLADPRQGRHWHLARLYLGPQGGGALAARGGARRHLASTSHQDQFLDARREVPVASRSAFVGRRRALQAVRRAFAADGHPGVLVHGIGNIGKSSFAHRLATRMTGHKTVVVFRHYDAPAVLDRLLDALPPAERQARRQQWRAAVTADATLLADALEDLLAGPFDAAPVLLVIDDLEQILEMPAPDDSAADVTVRPAFAATLAAVLGAFARVRSRSRLLLTSRYRFRLVDARGQDLAAALTAQPLLPMNTTERRKQMRAAAPADVLGTLDPDLLQRALDAADGNPGLQDTLTKPLLAGESGAARQAIAAIERLQRDGVAPDLLAALVAEGAAADTRNALQAFLHRMAFGVYQAALSPAQARYLAAARSFAPGLAIPAPALDAAAAALGVNAPAAARQRLLSLGLLDDWGIERATPHAAANPLARPLVPEPSEAQAQAAAQAAVPWLYRAWSESGGWLAPGARGCELCRLALLAPEADAAVLDTAATSAARYMHDALHATAAAIRTLLQPTLARLQQQGCRPSTALAHICFDCAERAGDPELQRAALERLRDIDVQDPMAAGASLVRLAGASQRSGQTAEAEQYLHDACRHFQAISAERELAIARGQVADILQARGQLDEALRIRQHEQLPVYERLGDVRTEAITLGKVADILQDRGQLDEALRIRQHEELPVYERLGDVRAKAVTMGRVADILQARGQLDEALHIRQHDELPVYERLGDVREKAVTMGKVADILQDRGQLDEALRIRQHEELPVYERLGDVREKAVTMGKVADILQDRGQLDEALRIRQHDELPVYERLGDVRTEAITRGKVADILQARGQLDEALRIRQHEELPVYERLGDVRAKAIAMGRVADILQARGQLDEALRIRQHEELPVYERLGDVREKAVTMGKVADILQARGQLDEALRIRQHEQLPVYERLGDVRAKAIAMGRVADILQDRGQLDEALRIRQHEQLPVYERLGDVRAKAIAMGRVADILQDRGQLDEALRIRQHEQLPVYERLGDVRAKAITRGKVADILQARGQLDEALRIRQHEELPVYERLGDVREKAIAMGKVADILQARGQLDEALRIRQHEQLSVYERLGDVREKAIAMGQVADILQDRGQFDEALRIHEERLPVLTRLGDAAGIAQAHYAIAGVLLARGDHEHGALQQVHDHLAQAFSISMQTGRVNAIGAIGVLLAQVLAMGGELQQALEVLSAADAAYRRLDDAPALSLVAELRQTIDALADASGLSE
ncbi:CHAT domain-containing protein [Pseudorhodoferax sp.]|uniref:CHAT domain-containing protein n=1 Tax=Pseudorhodoferax sp. TaxID=1993553 RepID=UPI0039E26A2E